MKKKNKDLMDLFKVIRRFSYLPKKKYDKLINTWTWLYEQIDKEATIVRYTNQDNKDIEEPDIG